MERNIDQSREKEFESCIIMLSQNNKNTTPEQQEHNTPPEECTLKSNCETHIFSLRKDAVVKNVNDF